jgi:hypothetical protein
MLLSRTSVRSWVSLTVLFAVKETAELGRRNVDPHNALAGLRVRRNVNAVADVRRVANLIPVAHDGAADQVVVAGDMRRRGLVGFLPLVLGPLLRIFGDAGMRKKRARRT